MVEIRSGEGERRRWREAADKSLRSSGSPQRQRRRARLGLPRDGIVSGAGGRLACETPRAPPVTAIRPARRRWWDHRRRRGRAGRAPARRRAVAVVILAIDQGTTGTTCLAVDEELRIRGRGYCELPQHFPKPGWVEHDPE